MRCAIVASGARNARAISSVVRPPTSRSVSATRASVDSTGWHAVNTSRRRSSPMSSRRFASTRGCASSSCASISRVSSSSFSACSLRWRRRSSARCLAVVMSHAAGLSGTPLSGHVSSAATRASCASSSASPTSRTMRATPAMMRADSMRKTASIALCVADPAIALPSASARLGAIRALAGRGAARNATARNQLRPKTAPFTPALSPPAGRG